MRIIFLYIIFIIKNILTILRSIIDDNKDKYKCIDNYFKKGYTKQWKTNLN